jgi:hypothetical protein
MDTKHDRLLTVLAREVWDHPVAGINVMSVMNNPHRLTRIG